MRLPDLFLTSSESLRRNTSRSLLTILGIIIGIAAVIVMLSIGQGAQGYVLNQVANLGSDVLFVEAGSGGGGPPSPFTQQTILLNDATALAKHGPFSVVSSIVVTNAPVTAQENSTFTDIAGSDEYQLDIFPAELASGRFIDHEDVSSHARVAVLGWDIAKDLFGDQDPIGERVTIKNLPARVIGVVTPQGSKFFSNLDTRIYIPVTTAQRELLNVDYVSYISMKAIGDVEIAKDEARAILRDTHALDNPNSDLAKDDFSVSSQSDAVNTIAGVGFALTLLLASIAAISLVVGGIGIMNMMLVSVTERTREIGLRKAIGGTERDILGQFLLEAVILTLGGGVLGVTIGVIVSFLASLLLKAFVDGWVFVIPPSAIAASFIVATVVGIAFGYYPAKRAAKLDPIEALRYE
ncbi:MAG: ABC transporter permease [Patescibacteria group bacterium]